MDPGRYGADGHFTAANAQPPSASADDDDLIFEGIDGSECEDFVRDVRRRARAADKDCDNDWIIRLVSACLAGDALRWHFSLDREIRNDWELLQQAMLARYPAFEETRVSQRPRRFAILPV